MGSHPCRRPLHLHLSCINFGYMKQAESMADQLRAQGHRMTVLRVALLALFEASSEPLSVKAILAQLEKQQVRVNKTSVYRELVFLVAQGLVKEILFGGGESLYESTREHHHHVVCRSCKTVEEVHMPRLEKNVSSAEVALQKKTRFSQIEHSLEFFGICQQCR